MRKDSSAESSIVLHILLFKLEAFQFLIFENVLSKNSRGIINIVSGFKKKI